MAPNDIQVSRSKVKVKGHASLLPFVQLIFPFLYHFAPYHFAPLSFCPPIILPPPLKLFHDLRYLPMSRIILPPGFILPPGNLLITLFLFSHSRIIFPYHFAPISFCPPPPPGNCFMITLFTHVQYHFAPGLFLPPYHFAPIILPPPPPWKWFNDLHYLPKSRIILPPALDFVFILIKSLLQQKLMTGAHPVTVAPLVCN